ncbi:PAS domain-containing protein [Arthrobacter sp. GAS37]|uniref:PAS domain-containing protein n=1 Tax=Arthrobacter sp. GAS37 TaxID=3156261 RepID=UPI003838F268
MTVVPALDPAVLPTVPPMSVAEVLDRQDGVYWVVKDANSVFLWVNQNFADLVGMSKSELIGHQDSRAEHVAHDKEVMASGKPLLNFHETIAVPSKEGGMVNVDIVTQKGLLRSLGSKEIIGITVCFSLKDPVT